MTAEFVLDTPVVRAFVADVERAIAAASSPAEACEAIRPRFAELLAPKRETRLDALDDLLERRLELVGA